MARHSTKQAFSLLEVLLVVALMGAVAGIGVPVYQSFFVQNNLDIAITQTAQTLRRAQISAQAMDGDERWGVRVIAGSIILFKGADYANRDTGFDEIYDLPLALAPSESTEFIFEKLSGFPQSPGTLTITSSSGASRSVTVNEKGAVNY